MMLMKHQALALMVLAMRLPPYPGAARRQTGPEGSRLTLLQQVIKRKTSSRHFRLEGGPETENDQNRRTFGFFGTDSEHHQHHRCLLPTGRR